MLSFYAEELELSSPPLKGISSNAENFASMTKGSLLEFTAA